MTDDELKDLVASLAIAQKKTDEQLARTDEQLAKTDARLAKTNAQLAKTDTQVAKMSEKIDKIGEHSSDIDERIDKLGEKLDRLSDKVERIADMVGGISNNQGDVAEEFFYRSLEKDSTLGKIHFQSVYRNEEATRNIYENGQKRRIHDEFDIILINDVSIAVVKVKQKAHPNLVDKMLNTKLPNFRVLYPQYKSYKLYGAIASLTSSDDLIDQVKEAGLFFMTQQGEHIALFDDNVKTF